MKKFALIMLTPSVCSGGDEILEIMGVFNNKVYAKRAFDSHLESLRTADKKECRIDIWYENVNEYMYVYEKSRGYPRALLGLDSFAYLFKCCIVEFDDGVNAYGLVLKELSCKLRKSN